MGEPGGMATAIAMLASRRAGLFMAVEMRENSGNQSRPAGKMSDS